MALTRLERERLTDSQLKLEAVANSLKGVNPEEIPQLAEISECLEDADQSIRKALRQSH